MRKEVLFVSCASMVHSSSFSSPSVVAAEGGFHATLVQLVIMVVEGGLVGKWQLVYGMYLLL